MTRSEINANMIILLNNKKSGDITDGYHTFDELYHHRTVLFASLCNAYPEKCWKSHHHHDGTMYDGMFIVGMETEFGQATYHCDEPYWEMFHVKDIENAPEWDGHTPAMAIDRIEKQFCKETFSEGVNT